MEKRRIPQEHVEILKKSGILSPDITLERLIDVAAELDESFTGAEVSVPTLIGNWYVYHTVEAVETLGGER